jgi:phosphoglycolate phosphatase
MAMFDLVLFDLDGTLIDTAPEIGDAVNALLKDYGLPPATESSVRAWIGHGARQTLVRALQQTPQGRALLDQGDSETVFARFDQHYRTHCGRRSRVYPGGRETLAALQAAGVRCAILSNKERRYAEIVLAAHGVLEFFELLVCGDSLPVRKPDPAPVHHCLREMKVTAGRALLVGDSDVDIATARNAGIAVWAVTYGYNGGKPIGLSRPDFAIESLDEIPRMLGINLAGGDSDDALRHRDPAKMPAAG